MQESFDAYQYLRYLRRRSRFILLVCASAALLAWLAGVLLPKQYTATATILIDAPAGNDPRTSISVSPMYLESLRIYELFAASDTLFQRALDKFHLRDPRSSTTLESWKRRTLKVTKLRDTKALQIAVTLPDARQAQAMAQFLADETVNLNRSANRANDQDLVDDAQTQMREAQARIDQEQAAWRDFNAREPVEGLRGEVQTLIVLRERVRRDLFDWRAELAELSVRAADARVAGVRARVESLEKQDTDLRGQMDSKTVLLSRREAAGDTFRQRMRAADVVLEAASSRLREARASAGLRGERLRVMDPGIVPERASWPNAGLDVLLALVVAFAACITYLTLTFHPPKT